MSAGQPVIIFDLNVACLHSLSFAGLVAFAKRLNPIPSRTRPLNASAPMVLCLKTWESRSLPGLLRTGIPSTRYKHASLDAGWSSPVARQAHNLKVISSNLVPATKFQNVVPLVVRRFFCVGVEQPVRAANDSQDRLLMALTSSGS